MGLERVASVIQKVHGNYDSDLLRDIIRATEELTNKRYVTIQKPTFLFASLLDHARAASFVIADGNSAHQ